MDEYSARKLVDGERVVFVYDAADGRRELRATVHKDEREPSRFQLEYDDGVTVDVQADKCTNLWRLVE